MLRLNNALSTNVVTDRRTISNTEESRILNQGDKEPASLLPPQCGFKLASLNINKLTTHIDELTIFLAHNGIYILSINETKLNATISDNEVNILGYDIVRRDRTTDGGGGVCFYVKKSINFTVRDDLNMETLENLCLEIQQPRSKPLLSSRGTDLLIPLLVSLPPFEHLIKIVDSENIEYYLMGDLNCDMIATRYDNDTCKLMSITDVYDFNSL